MMSYCHCHHSKVIEYAYNGCGDSGDEVSGHGTHVSGTAVGAIAGANIENGRLISSVSHYTCLAS